jgi:hypothetical protein
VPHPLNYSQLPRRVSYKDLAKRFFIICAFLSLLLFIVTVAMWLVSDVVQYPFIDRVTGESRTAPPQPHLPLPIPSDAAGYWVPLRGNLERWEYTGWDNKWYRVSFGTVVPIWIPAIGFAILPLAWIGSRIRKSGIWDKPKTSKDL